MTVKHRIVEVVTIVFGTALIVFLVRSCPVTVSVENETAPDEIKIIKGELAAINEAREVLEFTFFDTNGVSVSIEVKQGDHVEFMTGGSWTGCIIFEYSTDEITWIKEEFPNILSYNNRNVQFTSMAVETKYGKGMAPGFYRWNMVAMISGRCNYFWAKRQ